MASIIRDIVQFCLLVFLLLVAALYMAVAVEDNLTPKAVGRQVDACAICKNSVKLIGQGAEMAHTSGLIQMETVCARDTVPWEQGCRSLVGVDANLTELYVKALFDEEMICQHILHSCGPTM
ncbi:hypothetical protein AAVH_09114 [Aphelenchoides avenae]|nr:hypothetical protein AAVH_14416 [Aphelenchus avenae]KAH7723398.1 hypothetical protein AAVH_09114 [Aphelenchus avenae]